MWTIPSTSTAAKANACTDTATAKRTPIAQATLSAAKTTASTTSEPTSAVSALTVGSSTLRAMATPATTLRCLVIQLTPLSRVRLWWQPCDASFSPVGENDCCQGQCRVNEGDCDSDSDCAGNLVCSPGSCAWEEGDCCACPNGFEPEWHGLGCFNPQIVPACRGGGERVTGAGFLGEYFDGNFGELKLSRFDE
eukprot:1110351-Rhodomonas_salina.1